MNTSTLSLSTEAGRDFGRTYRPGRALAEAAALDFTAELRGELREREIEAFLKACEIDADCPECMGRGRFEDGPCEACNGAGTSAAYEAVEAIATSDHALAAEAQDALVALNAAGLLAAAHPYVVEMGDSEVIDGLSNESVGWLVTELGSLELRGWVL